MEVNTEQLKRRMASLSDDELRELVLAGEQEYSIYALEAACEQLRQRGIDPPSPREPSVRKANSEPQHRVPIFINLLLAIGLAGTPIVWYMADAAADAAREIGQYSITGYWPVWFCLTALMVGAALRIKWARMNGAVTLKSTSSASAPGIELKDPKPTSSPKVPRQRPVDSSTLEAAKPKVSKTLGHNVSIRNTEVDASSTDPIGQIKRLAELHDAGILSAEEFARKKSELLSRI